MNRTLKFFLFLTLFFAPEAFANSGEKPSFKLEIEIRDIQNGDGEVFIAIYNKSEDFLSETIYKGLKIQVQNRNSFLTTVELPQGDYALAVFHDQNSDGEMNRNFFYVPSEPYGFSNEARAILRPPYWSEALIQLKSDRKEVISLK